MFASLNELIECVHNWNIMADVVAKLKQLNGLELSDNEKLHQGLILLRKVLIENDVVRPIELTDWLTVQRDDYRLMLLYNKREKGWK